MVHAGLHKVVDYQDVDYGAEYLQRLQAFAQVKSNEKGINETAGKIDNAKLLQQAAKYIANAMCYDDILRVADSCDAYNLYAWATHFIGTNYEACEEALKRYLPVDQSALDSDSDDDDGLLAPEPFGMHTVGEITRQRWPSPQYLAKLEQYEARVAQLEKQTAKKVVGSVVRTELRVFEWVARREEAKAAERRKKKKRRERKFGISTPGDRGHAVTKFEPLNVPKAVLSRPTMLVART